MIGLNNYLRVRASAQQGEAKELQKLMIRNWRSENNSWDKSKYNSKKSKKSKARDWQSSKKNSKRNSKNSKSFWKKNLNKSLLWRKNWRPKRPMKQRRKSWINNWHKRRRKMNNWKTKWKSNIKSSKSNTFNKRKLSNSRICFSRKTKKIGIR